MRLVLFLGSHIEISKVEAVEFLGLESTTLEGDLLFADVSDSFDLSRISLLGGTPQVDLVVKEFGLRDKIVESLTEYIQNSKIYHFLLDFHSSVRESIIIVRKEVLRRLKKRDSSFRYAGDIRERSNNTVTKLKLLKKGDSVLTLIRVDNKYIITKSIYVQDSSMWSSLDYEKPRIDMKVGMLPSKLARIMVNLTLPESNTVIWDPFCGFGNVMIQALMLGAFAIGTDQSNEILKSARDNIRWAKTKGYIKKMCFYTAEYNIKSSEILKTILDMSRNAIKRAVVTEGFLGKMRRHPFRNRREAVFEWQRISIVYSNLLKKADSFLRSGDRLAIIFPKFKYLEGKTEKWYNTRSFSFGAYKDLSGGKILDWVHKDSIVGRELVVLEKR